MRSGWLLRIWIAISALTSLAYAITMVAKSQMVGIGTVIGYFLVSIIGPALLPDFVKEIFKYLPFSITSDAIGLVGPPGTSDAIGLVGPPGTSDAIGLVGPPGTIASVNAVEPTAALLITIGWLIACLAATCLSVERTEITG